MHDYGRSKLTTCLYFPCINQLIIGMMVIVATEASWRIIAKFQALPYLRVRLRQVQPPRHHRPRAGLELQVVVVLGATSVEDYHADHHTKLVFVAFVFFTVEEGHVGYLVLEIYLIWSTCPKFQKPQKLAQLSLGLGSGSLELLWNGVPKNSPHLVHKTGCQFPPGNKYWLPVRTSPTGQ